jgi:hypothetical protein
MADPVQDINESMKVAGDVLSTGVAAGSLMGVLPEISAVCAIVWYGIRIWESETVKGLFNRK